MKKKILCLALMTVLVLGTSMNVMAKDLQGSGNWTVDFDGKKMNSNFTSQNISDEMSGVQPGDSIDMSVKVINSSADDTDWYLTNEVLESLEDAAKNASGAAYTYRLAYVADDNSETVLYDSSTVGGEGSTAAGEGLHQATESTQDYMYLGRISQNQSGTVHLKVALDGESTANDYQRTVAGLQMNFGVEKVAAGNTTTVNRVVQNVVKTGDHMNLLWISIALLASGIVILILGVIIWKRRRQNDRKGE